MIGRPNLGTRVQDARLRYYGTTRTATLATIFHATDSTRWTGSGGTQEYLNSGVKIASYHYAIVRDGTIYRAVDARVRAYHAGVRCTRDPSGLGLIAGESVNATTIGIAFVTLNSRRGLITPKMLESALWLGMVIAERFSYAPERAWMHREVAPTWKSDVVPELLDADHWRSLLASDVWPTIISTHPTHHV